MEKEIKTQWSNDGVPDLTIRQHIAIEMAKSVLLNHDSNNHPQEIAGMAVQFADALIAELSK